MFICFLRFETIGSVLIGGYPVSFSLPTPADGTCFLHLRQAFFERKDAEREQGKGLGAKAASARGASEKLDGQSQAAPAKDNLEH